METQCLQFVPELLQHKKLNLSKKHPAFTRQFAPTFQRCPDSQQPLHYVPSLTLVDLIRTNSYWCPYMDCELNGNVHHALFNIQVDAATQNESFTQIGFSFLPFNVYNFSEEEDELCEMALTESEAEENEPCELALSDDGNRGDVSRS
ncbi:hypothetical protein N0V93_009508 [Gnomoniopsis smithogilvyi]|uniref:Uncharacterized protein n=1 Tax=Gnomoniopsis smithogilvyi TaxID=1191159 RepID=A0A9W8YJR9_9PEZI|nr:hypothetical protein N0V93_009508 [Gnomoniopsis smithogilvyi]